MLNFCRKAKGSISIFLCLILLPMVTYSTMIIDATRMQSARVNLQCAGDLALNAAMSEYDKVLEDMYGLFANATNPDDVEKAIRNYYEETITGILNDNTVAGGDRMYVKQFTEELTKRMMKSDGTNEDELINFLAMELEDDGFEYTPIQDSRISNPVVMKNQIIDYMKYKGPVSVGTNFLNKLGFLKDAKNQSQAAQSKIEYTQALSDLSSPMEKAYQNICSYNDNVEKFNKQKYGENVTIQNMTDKMRSDYEYMVDYYLMYKSLQYYKSKCPGAVNNQFYECLDTSSYAALNIENFNKSLSGDTADIANVTGDMDKLIEGAKQVQDLETPDTLSNFENKFGPINLTFDQQDVNIVTNVEFVGANYTLSGDYTPTFGNLGMWYSSNLDLPSDFDAKTDEGKKAAVLEIWNEQIGLMTHQKEYAEYKAYYEYYKNIYEEFGVAFNAYETKLKEDPNFDPDNDMTYQQYKHRYEAIEQIYNTWSNWSAHAQYKEVLNKIYNINMYYNQASEYYKRAKKEFKSYYETVCQLEKFSEQVVKNLDSILTELSEAEKTAETWQSNISQVEDQTAQSQMKSDADTLTKSVKREDIESLKKVFEPLHDRFKKLKEDCLEKVRIWGNGTGPQICKMPDTMDMESEELKPIFGDFVMTGNDPIVTGQTSFDEIRHKFDSRFDPLYAKPLIDNNTLADAAKGDAKEVDGSKDDEAFYTVLKNSYEAKNNKPQKDEKSEDQLANVNEISKVDENGMPTSTPTGGEQPAEAAKPKTGNDGDVNTVGTALKEITEETSSTSAGLGQASGVSIPSGNEDQGKMKEDANKGKDSLAGANKLLNSLAEIGTNFRDDVYLEEYFTEMFTCQTDKLKENGELKLLNGYTNAVSGDRILNSNNPWYGQEIEFILWGDPDLGKNLAKTETTIFLLRFALNAIYAFTAADIQQMANGMASLLVGWCPVLIPVVQVCIVLGVALAESGLDLMELKNGKDVPIIKDKSTFACSPSGLANKVTDEVVGKAVEYANNKVDEALDGIADTTKKTIGDCMGDIRAAADTYAEQQVATIKSGIKDQFVTPFINTIAPIISQYNGNVNNADALVRKAIDQAWKTIGDNINTSSEVGQLTKKLYDNQGETKKNQIIQTISSKIQQANVTASDIQNALNDTVEGWFGAITKEFENLTKKLSDRIESELGKHVDESKENIKSYLDEQISDIGDDLAGTAKSLVKSSSGKIPDDVVDTNSKSVAAKITMNYKEYCKLFMFINMVGDETKCLQRAAALIQANVQYAAKDANSGFKMTQAYTMFHVGADVKLGTLFPWSPVTVTAGEGTGTSTDVDLTKLGGNYVTMQYSGINGY